MKKEMDGVTAFATLLATVVLFIFNAFVTFWIGYFLGWLAMKTVGSPLTYGLNCLFATTMFKETMQSIKGIIKDIKIIPIKKFSIKNLPVFIFHNIYKNFVKII